MAVAVTGEAATDGSLALGFNLNFSLDPGGGFNSVAPAAAQRRRGPRHGLSRSQRQWRPRPVRAVRKGRVGHHRRAPFEKCTDAKGSVWSAASPPSRRSPSASTTASLADPMLVPRKAMQVVVPRPGVPADGRNRPGRRRRYRGRDRQERRARASKASTSSWSTPTGKIVPPRAPISTAFSCSSACPTAISHRVCRSDSAQAAAMASPSSMCGLRSAPARSIVRLGSIHVEPLPKIASRSNPRKRKSSWATFPHYLLLMPRKR